MTVTKGPQDTQQLHTPRFMAPAVPSVQSRIVQLYLFTKEQCLKARELLAYLAVFLLMYSVCYIIPFAFYDDYENLYHADTLGSSVDMFTPVENGRAIQAYLFKWTFSVVHDLNELRYVRLISVIGIALCAWLTFWVLRRVGMRYWPAFCIPIVVFALPGYQVFVAWSLSAFHAYGLLLAGAALLLTERALTAPFTRRFWLLLSLASLLELASMMTYQPAAMMYLFFAAIVLFVGHVGVAQSLKRLGVYLGVTFLAIGLDDASLHALPALILGQGAPDPRTQLVHDIPGKIVWFLKQPLRNALNLTSITPSTRTGVLIGTFIVIGLLLYFKGTIETRLVKLVLALSLLPISYFPSLVTVDNFAAYRYMVAMGSLLVLYLALAIIGFAGLLDYVSLSRIKAAVITVPLMLFALYAGVIAAKTVTLEFALPQYTELAYLNSQLQPVKQQHPHVIYFVLSTIKDSTAPVVLYDEFGLPSSVKSWNAAPMVYLALQETDPADEHVQVRVITEDAIKNLPAGSIVIDMSKLKDARVEP
ncbi:MAG: hypothetical protein ACLQUY_11075 [Ktedonobacterales bacterium]